MSQNHPETNRSFHYHCNECSRDRYRSRSIRSTLDTNLLNLPVNRLECFPSSLDNNRIENESSSSKISSHISDNASRNLRRDSCSRTKPSLSFYINLPETQTSNVTRCCISKSSIFGSEREINATLDNTNDSVASLASDNQYLAQSGNNQDSKDCSDPDGLGPTTAQRGSTINISQQINGDKPNCRRQCFKQQDTSSRIKSLGPLPTNQVLPPSFMQLLTLQSQESDLDNHKVTEHLETSQRHYCHVDDQPYSGNQDTLERIKINQLRSGNRNMNNFSSNTETTPPTPINDFKLDLSKKYHYRSKNERDPSPSETQSDYPVYYRNIELVPEHQDHKHHVTTVGASASKNLDLSHQDTIFESFPEELWCPSEDIWPDIGLSTNLKLTNENFPNLGIIGNTEMVQKFISRKCPHIPHSQIPVVPDGEVELALWKGKYVQVHSSDRKCIFLGWHTKEHQFLCLKFFRKNRSRSILDELLLKAPIAMHLNATKSIPKFYGIIYLHKSRVVPIGTVERFIGSELVTTTLKSFIENVSNSTSNSIYEKQIRIIKSRTLGFCKNLLDQLHKVQNSGVTLCAIGHEKVLLQRSDDQITPYFTDLSRVKRRNRSTLSSGSRKYLFDEIWPKQETDDCSNSEDVSAIGEILYKIGIAAEIQGLIWLGKMCVESRPGIRSMRIHLAKLCGQMCNERLSGRQSDYSDTSTITSVEESLLSSVPGKQAKQYLLPTPGSLSTISTVTDLSLSTVTNSLSSSKTDRHSDEWGSTDYGDSHFKTNVTSNDSTYYDSENNFNDQLSLNSDKTWISSDVVHLSTPSHSKTTLFSELY